MFKNVNEKVMDVVAPTTVLSNEIVTTPIEPVVYPVTTLLIPVVN